MKIALTIVRLFALFGCAELLAPMYGQEVSPAPVTTYTSESVFRKRVKEIVRPECVAEPTQGQSAQVVVARTEVGPDGRVLYTAILEAPSAAHADSVRQAISHWIFDANPNIGTRPQIMAGKLTFYFVRSGDGCTVLYPSEVGYVGRWTATRSGPARTASAAARSPGQ